MKVSFHYEPGNGFVSDEKGMDTLIMKDPLLERTTRISPTELLVYAMGGCSSADVVLILTRMRKNIKSYKVEVEAEREELEPKTLKDVNIHYIMEGDFSDENAKRAVTLSLERYCSVSILAKRGGTHLTYSITLNGEKLVHKAEA
ncbi:MAG: OsmC family protein [Candidatus Thermoplasmatota archaeon]|jgi:putative redox protein|nr:OsmC family protein [Candidatus Thermoplasmatota archaeon]MCL5790363.1 OsmC family protein [Candidatus Thermoplasmatota archaeon]